MKEVKINLIAAIGENRELGKDDHLLWHIREDLDHFRKLTQDQIVLMGRKTFQSIGKKLPQRINIVVSRQKNFSAQGCLVFSSLEKGLAVARKIAREENRQIFIIGGATIYKQTIDLADRLYLTIVEGKFIADVFFPDYSAFTVVKSQKEFKGKKYHLVWLELARS